MTTDFDYNNALESATKLIADFTGDKAAVTEASSAVDRRRLLKHAMTVLGEDAPLPQPLMKLCDDILAHELKYATDVVDAMELPRLAQSPKIALWRGDITKLRIGGIVNAANSRMLGCFRPDHPCIDNAIHCAAGPQLRQECRRVMELSGRRDSSTDKAVVTPAFSLPSEYVFHTVGPIAQHEGHEQPDQLASCYRSVLDGALERGVKSVAFCCISTGMFGYPAGPAAAVALATVRDWLNDHAPDAMDLVVFNTFTERDTQLYAQLAPEAFGMGVGAQLSCDQTETVELAAARQWISDADALLVVAGAGMSANDGNNVYVSEKDFAAHYPGMLKWGYRTSYECMGLFGDERVPAAVKWGLLARHMTNMRWNFETPVGYDSLLEIVESKGRDNWFVLTSNVDGMFERAGFDATRIYTPQGDMSKLQCHGSTLGAQTCRAVVDSRPYCEHIVSVTDWETNCIRSSAVNAALDATDGRGPKCPACDAGRLGPNLRGGDWFVHDPYEAAQRQLSAWLESLRSAERSLCVIEIGAGFNTPTVTRFPAESIARDFGVRGSLVRINPKDFETPSDLPRAVGLESGWEALQRLGVGSAVPAADIIAADTVESARSAAAERQARRVARGGRPEDWQLMKQHWGHFDWRTFFTQLRR